jgi:hypothetical protein
MYFGAMALYSPVDSTHVPFVTFIDVLGGY